MKRTCFKTILSERIKPGGNVRANCELFYARDKGNYKALIRREVAQRKIRRREIDRRPRSQSIVASL